MSAVEQLQRDLELKKLQLASAKASVVIQELEMKIQERLLDVARMQEHIKLQQDIVETCAKQLK